METTGTFDVKLARFTDFPSALVEPGQIPILLVEDYFDVVARGVSVQLDGQQFSVSRDQLRLLDSELERVANSTATQPTSLVIQTPFTFVGTSDVTRAGIPPLFSPSTVGRRFIVGNDTNPTVLNFSNMTIWLPEYTGSLTTEDPLQTVFGGVFQIGRGSLACFMNSTIVMSRCQEQEFQLLCLNSGAINFYSRQFAEAQAPQFREGVQFARTFQCISFNPVGTSSTDNLAIIITIPVLVVFLALCGAVTFWRYRRYQRRKELEVENVKREVENVMQEKVKVEQEKRHMETMYLDLLHNTESITRGSITHPVGAQNTDTRLMFMDQKDPTNIQRQLQSMLSGSDEAITVQGEIGRGAFGVVYQGIWKNMQVAIKTVLFQTSGDQLKDDPVIREATIAMRISHMHLVATYCANVRILDDGVGQGSLAGSMPVTGNMRSPCQLFLVQEFCDAGTLYDWLSKSRLHPGNVPDKAVIVRCALDIALGIQALHRSNIVHGDLKPQNVLLTTMSKSQMSSYNSPTPAAWPYLGKLTDFGLSFKLEENKSHLSGLHVGTPFYFAPEVQGRGYLSTAADMYSFGVLLWELYHGMPPYASEKGHLVANHLFPRFSLRHRADAPFSYCVLALACLSKHYQERPTIDEAVAVLEDLNRSINCDTAEGRRADTVMRMAAVNRLTKGETGLTAPASLVAEAARSAPPASLPIVSSEWSGRSSDAPEMDVAALVLSLLERSGLKRDPVLFQRIAKTNSSEKRRLAGMNVSTLRSTSHEQELWNVHQHNMALFDLLPQTSVVRQPDTAAIFGDGPAHAAAQDRAPGGRAPRDADRDGESVEAMQFPDQRGTYR